MPNLVRVNRGKMSTDEIAEKALDYKANRAVIVDRWHGGPGDIKLFKIEESGLVSLPPIMHVAGMKLQREFRSIKVKHVSSISVESSRTREELNKVADVLSSFFGMPIKSVEQLLEESETIMYLLQDDIGRVVITFMSEPNRVEIGPRIVVSSLEWQVP